MTNLSPTQRLVKYFRPTTPKLVKAAKNQNLVQFD